VRYSQLPEGALEPIAPDLSLGVVEGETHLTFGDIRGIEIADDGTIYVLDHQASEIRAFSPDGSFQGLVAQRGQGPGEILRANGLVRASDGTLWVQDHGQWQLIRLQPAGGEIERTPMFVRQFGYLWDGAIDEMGRIWTGSSRPLSPFTPGQPPEPGLQQSEIAQAMVVHDLATGTADTIPVAISATSSYVVALQGGWQYRSIPFQASHLTATDPAGAVWSAMGDAYRIARLDTKGDTTLVIEVAHTAAMVTAADREAFITAARERSPEEERVARELSRAMPERKPALSQLVVDDVGRLWVRRYQEDADEPARFDVFDRTGHYLGSIRLGIRISPHFSPRIRDGRLYTVAVDALDVPSVIRIPVGLSSN
jgi:streptogramin lyase